jgi:nitrite reductase/ring-hydroxylating ferredoxin subunit
MKEIKKLCQYSSIEKDSKQFLEIANSKSFIEGKGEQLIFADDIDLQVAIFRIKNKLYAVSNICPHRHSNEIYNGVVDGVNIVCPLHGWTYCLENGMNINPKQGQRNLIKYEIFEFEGKVYLEKPEITIPKWRSVIEL